MESCWEDDGDARLTVQCVHERIKQLIYEPLDDTFALEFLEKLKMVTEEHSTKSSSASTAGACSSSGSEMTCSTDLWSSSFNIQIA